MNQKRAKEIRRIAKALEPLANDLLNVLDEETEVVENLGARATVSHLDSIFELSASNSDLRALIRDLEMMVERYEHARAIRRART